MHLRKVEPVESFKPLSDKMLFNHIILNELCGVPCRCCGNPEHGVFHPIRNIYDEKTMILSCPVVEGRNWESVLRQSVFTMRFPPNTKRFAESYSEDIEEALKRFRLDGHAQHMSYMPLVDFENDVYSEVLRIKRIQEVKRRKTQN